MSKGKGMDLTMTKILVADDEENMTSAIAYVLMRENYEVFKAYDGNEAIEIIEKEQPQILILDVMMPIYNGYDICKRFCDKSDIGIIMLTAKSNLIDKVLGLELGADDYMTKPFEIEELLARVRSLERRIQKNRSRDNEIKQDDIMISEGVKIDLKERVVYVDDQLVEFKAKEYDLLIFLMNNIKTTFTRDTILNSVWGMDYYGNTRTVDIHILRIRKKLGKYCGLIKTVPKVGYKMIGIS